MTTPDFDLFTYFERTPDFVCIASKEGYFQNVNPAVVHKLEYTIEELLSRPISDFVHPEDKDATQNSRANLLNNPTLLNFQNRYVSKSGKVLWLEWTSIFLADKEVIFGIAKDITARKLVEQEVEKEYDKFKGLTSQFKNSLEEDRKYLAAELHEELAQLASAVRIDLDWIDTNDANLPPASKNRIEHALAVSDLLVATIRKFSFSISPDMLNDLGLNATLDWHGKEFAVSSKIPCTFKFSYNEENLNAEMKLDFFRICQEALDNVRLHAKATKVKISIMEKGGIITLIISDNGIGFDINQDKPSPGLQEMRGRASSINAQLQIKTAPGKGTEIRVSVAKYEGPSNSL